MKIKHERTNILGNLYFSHGPTIQGLHADVIVEMLGGKVTSIKEADAETINKYEAITKYY